jgi:hypothetical protein
LNPGRRGGKPANNRLSYGAAVGFGLSLEIVLQSFLVVVIEVIIQEIFSF